MRIVRIVLERAAWPLDPPFVARWDPEPRTVHAATIVRVETDDGLVGVGSGDSLDGVDSHLERFLGADPTRVEEHVRVLETLDFHGGRPWPFEAALWDVVGQSYGVGVWRLMGGVRDRIAAYASTGARRRPEAQARLALQLADEGFPAMKLRVDPRDADAAVDEVAAVVDAVAGRLDVMVDLNQAWRMPGDTRPPIDVVTARRLVDAFADLGVFWVEEPLPAADLDGLAGLRALGRVRIAGGEMTRTFDEALTALDADVYDVHQPDVVLSCGLWRGRTLAELAQRRGRAYTPHTWTNGLGLLANLHVAAGAGGGPYLEYPYDPDGWRPAARDPMLAEPIRLLDGHVICPDEPGLGVALDEAAIAHALTDRRELRDTSARVWAASP